MPSARIPGYSRVPAVGLDMRSTTWRLRKAEQGTGGQVLEGLWWREHRGSLASVAHAAAASVFPP